VLRCCRVLVTSFLEHEKLVLSRIPTTAKYTFVGNRHGSLNKPIQHVERRSERVCWIHPSFATPSVYQCMHSKVR
jgi:hypothetical protein